MFPAATVLRGDSHTFFRDPMGVDPHSDDRLTQSPKAWAYDRIRSAPGRMRAVARAPMTGEMPCNRTITAGHSHDRGETRSTGTPDHHVASPACRAGHHHLAPPGGES